ncbi:hypothetical protein [Paenibacillus glacialis]|uniref:Uncharacterized protein n=1 Tax=Paenibacillus glacialis TaxID=494026 RepID=A0A168MCK7_9BACL|nr:hypothetical protein [Paenibacillus glacialis]OAB44512.1 hypothetical protein PGLA_07610 [Paenibacillus glacialis]
MARLKFDIRANQQGGGVICSFTDGKKRTSETWFGAPPDSINHVGPEYLQNRLPNARNERHYTFIKRRFKEEIGKFKP